MSGNSLLAVSAAVIAIIVPGSASAYVGPGAGLGMLGSLIAVLCAVFVALIGLVVLPFRMLLKRRKAKAPGGQEAAAGQPQDIWSAPSRER